ncbi:hypothetical protein HDV05_003026, partial [Chytridiales sp. JEL 0842]
MLAFLADIPQPKTLRSIIFEQDAAKAQLTEDALQEWILASTPREKAARGLDPTFRLPYSQAWGFKVSIDHATHLKHKAFSVAILRLYPAHSAFTNAAPTMDQANLTFYTGLYTSSQTNKLTELLLSSKKWYRNVKHNPRLLAVIDIKCLTTDRSGAQILQQGWSFIPVFYETTEQFVKGGLYRVPL